MLCVGICINQWLLYRQEAGRNGIEILFLIDSVHRWAVTLNTMREEEEEELDVLSVYAY